MLTLKTKSVRFEMVDDDAEIVVTLSSEDDQPTLIRKLRRVIALVEGETLPPLPVREPGATLPLAVRMAADEPPIQTGNGWAAAFAPPEVPERLQGEIELIEPEET